MIGRTLGHYRIEKTLGAGGMGIVYAARDLKLERIVALKVMHDSPEDARLRERLYREARAAASLNHPGICQVFEIGEENGEPYIVMELLEGEPLVDRLQRGPLAPGEAVRIGLEVLHVLEALHGRGLVHRDIKPSNVFLLADGRVKLLDFGLARPSVATAGVGSLTATGLAVGSPGYMAPEQTLGEPVDARTDLFSLAAAIYEAISGTRAFSGSNPIEMMYAVLHARPGRLTGSPALERVGRVLDRSMSRKPQDRHASAAEFARELREAWPREMSPASSISSSAAPPQPVRLAVLPFRLLRPDPELEFLGPSLADAIAMSLAGIRSLVVRSTMAAARWASAAPDLREMAETLEVDAVLTGTILPAGDRGRVAAQLVEAPRGDVLWSRTLEFTGRDVFQLQDTLTKSIVESLQLPLSTRERGVLARNSPVSPTAYEFFLRANRAAVVGQDLRIARDLYLRAVESDPDYAPIWARLGRCHRLLGKYRRAERLESYRRAEEALQKALALEPTLPAAHHALAHLELDLGRPEEGLERLLGVAQRNPNDPESHAGLVTAYRYFGLVDDSLAAHARARELDPEIRTSVAYTIDATGDSAGALAVLKDEPFRCFVLLRLGRFDEAYDVIRTITPAEADDLFNDYWDMMHAIKMRDAAALVRVVERFRDFPDPEGLFYNGFMLSLLGEYDRAMDWVERGVDGGYPNVAMLKAMQQLDPLRGTERFQAMLKRAEERSAKAAARFGGRISATTS